MKFNELDFTNWKEIDINVESLWILASRDNSGKHKNIYHGNFIPQIPEQLIKRYSKKAEVVLDLFLGSGTTMYVCEKLDRKCIGFDINSEILHYVQNQMHKESDKKFFIQECDVSNTNLFENKIQLSLEQLDSKFVNFFIAHPPYMDIIKFTNKKEDLSQISNIIEFIDTFVKIIKNALAYLETKRYFSIVIGDIYRNSEVLPLAFYILDAVKRNFNVKLKGIVIKNIEGNRGKLGQENIWKYRALKSDYFIFKHEYILVFKKNY